MAETKKYLYEFPGLYDYHGLPMCSLFPESSLDQIKSFPYGDGDIVVQTYPKSGTLWMQEIAWLVNNNADVEKANETIVGRRVPFLEAHFAPAEPNMDVLKRTSSPRLIKTHMPPSFFEKPIREGKVKFIVVIRNPKDTLVSYYNFYRIVEAFGKFPGSWDTYFEMFLNEELVHGDWFDNVLGWWAFKDRPNFLFLHFEDMKKDLKTAVQKVASFCEKDLSEEQIDKIVHHCSFQQMRKNPSTNRETLPHILDSKKGKFLRKGSVGDWKNTFTVAQNELFDKLYEEKMAGSGIDIDFTLQEAED